MFIKLFAAAVAALGGSAIVGVTGKVEDKSKSQGSDGAGTPAATTTTSNTN